MAYKHGIYTSEIPTSIVPPINGTACLPVVFGTAPLHLATDRAQVNKPVLCYTYAEAVAALGYSDDWKSYTLCEVIKSQFALYNRAPVVFVNVLDPAVHKKSVTAENVALTNHVGYINDPVLLETLKLKETSDGDYLTEGIDYEAAYNDEGALVITALTDGAIAAAVKLVAEYDKLDPEAVDGDDIVGGIDVSTGAVKGLETLNNVFPLFGLVPSVILAPGWTGDAEIAAVMKAKASNINSHFKAITLNDIPTKTVKKYTDVAKWKNDNNYTDPLQVACWPMVRLGDDIYHMSTHILGVLATVDSDNGDVPNESPSNKTMQINGTCLDDGTEVILGNEQANYLNGQGIITALNFISGWKCWGNRTACYPSNTDVKDSMLCIRRMFIWHSTTFIQTYWAKVDKPITKRLIHTILDSENMRLNGLAAEEKILGGRVEFIDSENPTTSLMDGIIKFHTYLSPSPAARDIENVLEYDPTYFQTLFS